MAIILCLGPGPHIGDGTLGDGPVGTIACCGSDPCTVAALTLPAAVAAQAEQTNAETLRTRADAARTLLASTRTTMATITGTSGSLTNAQLSDAVRALAGAVDDLARIDIGLIRLILNAYDGTD